MFVCSNMSIYLLSRVSKELKTDHRMRHEPELTIAWIEDSWSPRNEFLVRYIDLVSWNESRPLIFIYVFLFISLMSITSVTERCSSDFFIRDQLLNRVGVQISKTSSISWNWSARFDVLCRDHVNSKSYDVNIISCVVYFISISKYFG